MCLHSNGCSRRLCSVQYRITKKKKKNCSNRRFGPRIVVIDQQTRGNNWDDRSPHNRHENATPGTPTSAGLITYINVQTAILSTAVWNMLIQAWHHGTNPSCFHVKPTAVGYVMLTISNYLKITRFSTALETWVKLTVSLPHLVTQCNAGDTKILTLTWELGLKRAKVDFNPHLRLSERNVCRLALSEEPGSNLRQETG
jgi:hypothetical protein